MTRLGMLHHNALGVARDPAAAADWWRKAALLGDADGQAMLGAAHHIGAGVSRDAVAALAWLLRGQRGGSKLAEPFMPSVTAACTPTQRQEAERRAIEPLTAAGAP